MTQLNFPKIISYLTCGISVLSLAAVGQMPKANAASMTYSATGTNSDSGGATNALSASALFDDSLGGGKLKITLTNTGPGASVPSDILTALFWDYDGAGLSLSLTSATAPIVIKNGSTATSATNVNLQSVGTNPARPIVEWGFASATSSSGLGGDKSPRVTQRYGLGTAGFGISPGFGLSGGQQFNYGIITGFDGANPAVSGGTFVKNSADFVLSGLPTGFDVNKVKNVRFQYGTGLDEPSTYYVAPPTPPVREIPESSTTVGLGLFAVLGLRVLKRKSLAFV
jgi:hypothetical protein